MRKKVLVALGMTILLNQFAFAADITYSGVTGNTKVNEIQFQDVNKKGSSYWAAPAIYEMTALSVMNGFSSSVFSPDSYVTNEQAITIVLNALGKANEVQQLKGIANTWSDKYIKYAISEGLISEKIVMKKADISGNNLEAMKKKGVLIRDNTITREEIAGLICRAFSLTPKEENKVEFYDKGQIDSKYTDYVDAISSNGIMVGSDDKMFNPKSGLKRAELAQIFKNCENMLLDGLGVIKKSGFIDAISNSSLLMMDEEDNEIAIDLAGKNIPVFRSGVIGDKSALKVSDEIEYFVGTDKTVLYIRVIDEGIDGTFDRETSEFVSKQGIVIGNSPYFYQISIKNRLGETETYTYGKWTSVWKDGKESVASNIMQGDTVYLEFDALGDLVGIRGVTNSVITFGTVIKLSGNTMTIEDEEYMTKDYWMYQVPVYKNGEEIALNEVHTGEYVKFYSSASELIKVEIVPDTRTVYHIYKGYISDVNQVQDRIILKDTEIYEDSKWKTLSENFVTIPMDSEMAIHYDSEAVSMEELGEKQVGKYAYIVTREDTKTLEKIKSMVIGDFEKEVTSFGEFRSYSKASEQLRIYDDSESYVVAEDTLFIIDGKVVKLPKFEAGEEVKITAVYENGDYVAKVVVVTEKEEKIEEEPLLYSGIIKYIEEEEEVSLRLTEKFDGSEWYSVKNKNVSFFLTKESRIFTESGPINIRELTDEGIENYKESKAVIVALGDEIVALSVIDIGKTPYLLRGYVNSTTEEDFVISDTEYYDFEEEEWMGIKKTTVVLEEMPVIVKNGEYVRQKSIEKGQEVLVLKKDKDSNVLFVLLTEE